MEGTLKNLDFTVSKILCVLLNLIKAKGENCCSRNHFIGRILEGGAALSHCRNIFIVLIVLKY